ncbi:hypothetical protein CEJ86_32350 [Sinorhizobium meliloti]|uniref:Uncharacterized protein n=1 Tax=Rhizobium meliloti TaxID=382 RepID=A0A2J0YT39_RHIML|nr:hypothetical protein CEJ86_32350 [Sinorhizobium meliloti]
MSPAQGSVFWVSPSKMKKTGLFLPLRNLSESARTAEREAGIGTAGTTAASRTACSGSSREN